MFLLQITFRNSLNVQLKQFIIAIGIVLSVIKAVGRKIFAYI